jgi:hypothetical protein
MRRIRQIAPIFLAAVFWIAQVQGTFHGIGHIAGTTGVSDHATAPHATLCGECAAFAQAGAAPILALAATVLSSPTDGVVTSASTVVVAAEPASAYRSRAPPISPI